MKSGWELKFEDRHWAAGVSGAIVLLVSAFIYAFFSQADATFATAFSKALSLKVDLGRCSSSFANLIMAQISYALTICLVLLGLMACLAVVCVRDAANRAGYLKLLLGTSAFILILLAMAMNDDGFWLSSTGRRFFGRRLSIADACLQSHNTNFIRIYVMSIWLGFGSWMLIMMDILCFRAIALRRNHNDLPTDSGLHAEILDIHAKYGGVRRPTQARRWKLSAVVVAGLFLAAGIHGLYKLALVLGAL
ncbi:hypothetical protein [Mesorhizobium sp. M0684]|uniref:hypothetical protein n=1 Tax=unclassified Mesorhizobium TaxID=325217 RepID=UPI00333BE34C